MSKPPATTSAAREALRAFAPKLVDLTDNVLFGDVWERPGLSKRDRSLITCAALIALNRTEQLNLMNCAASSAARSGSVCRPWEVALFSPRCLRLIAIVIRALISAL